MTTPNDGLSDWLGDAHAMETQAAALLAAQTPRMRAHPDLQSRFELHLRETNEQRDMLESVLKSRAPAGIAKSPARRGVSRRVTDMGGDELLNFAMDFYAAKYREIAAYRVLITAAEASGDEAIQRLCGEILWQEDAMAAWLRIALPQLARDRLAEKAPAARRRARPTDRERGRTRPAAH